MSAASPSPAVYSPGLEGVVGGETAVSCIDDGLRYRGYPVGELCEKATFDEVAHLLLHGDLPTAKQLAAFQARVTTARRIPEPVKQLYPHTPRWAYPLDALRTAVSMVALFDPDATDNSHEANVRKAERLLGQMPVMVADQYRVSKGLQPVMARPELGHSANFLYMLKGTEPTPEEVRALDVSLILYAEHEFNASTFTARVIVSTQSDLHSGIVGAIGALMGFGHRVYKAGDVRAGILKGYAKAAATTPELQKWEDTADTIERVMAEKKNMFPNLDWPAGRLYHAMGLEIPLYTPMFAMSRITGWAAHVIEQTDHNRLIRPRSLYTGEPARSVKPIAERG
jgi:citrate synthase